MLCRTLLSVLQVTLSYKSFTLKIIASGAVGQDIMDLSREVTHNFDGEGTSLFNVSTDVKDRWRPGDDLSSKRIPGTAGNDQPWRWANSEFIFDGSYLSIRNITLSYNLIPKNSTTPFQQAEFYTSVQNVAMITSFYGNPEVGKAASGTLVRNVNYGSYPLARVFTTGVRFTF